MRKWGFIILIIALTTTGLFMVEIKDTHLRDIINNYEEKWGIKLPEPDDREILWYPESNFFGDGEYVNVYTYSNNPNIEQSDIWPVVEENIDYVKEIIQLFIDESTALSRVERKLEAFQRIQTEADAEVGDYFFYTSKNKGNDYFIVLYKQVQQRLYTFEWHQ